MTGLSAHTLNYPHKTGEGDISLYLVAELRHLRFGHALKFRKVELPIQQKAVQTSLLLLAACSSVKLNSLFSWTNKFRLHFKQKKLHFWV